MEICRLCAWSTITYPVNSGTFLPQFKALFNTSLLTYHLWFLVRFNLFLSSLAHIQWSLVARDWLDPQRIRVNILPFRGGGGDGYDNPNISVETKNKPIPF